MLLLECDLELRGSVWDPLATETPKHLKFVSRNRDMLQV